MYVGFPRLPFWNADREFLSAWGEGEHHRQRMEMLIRMHPSVAAKGFMGLWPGSVGLLT